MTGQNGSVATLSSPIYVNLIMKCLHGGSALSRRSLSSVSLQELDREKAMLGNKSVIGTREDSQEASHWGLEFT